MSLAATHPNCDLTERNTPLGVGSVHTDDERACRPYPGQFAAPAEVAAPRRTVRLSSLSLSTILRGLVGKPTPPRAALVSSANPSSAPSSAARRKLFSDSRPNLLEDRMTFDELDPLPFVDDDRIRGDRRPFDDGDRRAAASDDGIASYPPCDVTERRERPPFGVSRPDFDGSDSKAIFECRLLDFNMSGIALCSVRSFPRGAIVDVRIGAAHSERVIEAVGTVVRCELRKAGGFQVVCRLKNYLQFAEIRDLGRELFAAAIV